MIQPDPVKIAWIAGLVEGEGWFGIRPPARPHIQVVSTDVDVVERLKDWSGVGNTTGPHPPTEGSKKETYRWLVTKRDDAAALLEALLPFMCERRAEKFAEVLSAYHAAPPTKGTAPTCGYGHELTPENLRIVDGRRRCLKCAARRQRDHRARVSAATVVDNAMIVA